MKRADKEPQWIRVIPGPVQTGRGMVRGYHLLFGREVLYKSANREKAAGAAELADLLLRKGKLAPGVGWVTST